MNRPSNLILAFIATIASAFIAYAISRLLFRAVEVPETEIEEDIEEIEEIESQLYLPPTLKPKYQEG